MTKQNSNKTYIPCPRCSKGGLQLSMAYITIHLITQLIFMVLIHWIVFNFFYLVDSAL